MSDPRKHLMPVYAPPKEIFVKGEGSYLHTETGEKYLDFICGIAVTSLGHNHPALVSALQDQAGKLWHTSNMFRVPAAETLAAKMCRDTFADRVFFTNSGTESIECAIKSARKYHYKNGAPERVDIISFTGAFHGRSLGAINAGGNPKYLEGYGPALPGFIQIAYENHEALKAAITSKTAAVIVEPVQGEGGVRAIPTKSLDAIRALCNEQGILLIYDEVQCGVGRTGQLFAHQWAENAEPDIMAVAKGVGGGFPFGACLMTEKVAQVMQPGSHGSTYGGNPLAMAVGNAVWDIISDKQFLQQVRKRGETLFNELRTVAVAFPDKVEGVTGKGLLMGLKMKGPPKPFQIALRDEKLLVGVAGNNVLRVVPPLNVEARDIHKATETMISVLKQM
ncbi:MAG: aspartate aminotransferase family protein [Maricaulaceae bacterium]